MEVVEIIWVIEMDLEYSLLIEYRESNTRAYKRARSFQIKGENVRVSTDSYVSGKHKSPIAGYYYYYYRSIYDARNCRLISCVGKRIFI